MNEFMGNRFQCYTCDYDECSGEIYTEDVEFKVFKFSGGEISVKLLNPERVFNTAEIDLSVNIANSEGVMLMALLSDAIKRANPDVKFNLSIPYFPYGRQDRVCDKGESFSLHVFSNIVNSIRADAVYTLYPHSCVTTQLIRNLENEVEDICFDMSAISQVDSMFEDEELVHVFPDKGAKYRKFTFENKFSGSVVFDKQRDTSTGEIIKYDIEESNADIDGKVCVIIDDICDGGKTFIECSRILKEKGAAKVVLIVAHGIFSKGFDEIVENIDLIVTSDSVYTGGNRVFDNNTVLKVVKVEDDLDEY